MEESNLFRQRLVCAAFQTGLVPGLVNQDAPHGLGGGPEEMGTSAPLLLVRTGQAQPGFVDERGGLQGLAGFLLRHPGGGELAQLLINEREQLIGGLGVTLLNAVEDACDVAHAFQSTAAATGFNSKQCKA